MLKQKDIKGLDICRDFYHQIFKPLCLKITPKIYNQIVCGRFGSGSEFLG